MGEFKFVATPDPWPIHREVAKSTKDELANIIIAYAEEKEMTMFNVNESVEMVKHHMGRNAVLKK